LLRIGRGIVEISSRGLNREIALDASERARRLAAELAEQSRNSKRHEIIGQLETAREKIAFETSITGYVTGYIPVTSSGYPADRKRGNETIGKFFIFIDETEFSILVHF